jgi:hypothetical protein
MKTSIFTKQNINTSKFQITIIINFSNRVREWKTRLWKFNWTSNDGFKNLWCRDATRSGCQVTWEGISNIPPENGKLSLANKLLIHYNIFYWWNTLIKKKTPNCRKISFVSTNINIFYPLIVKINHSYNQLHGWAHIIFTHSFFWLELHLIAALILFWLHDAYEQNGRTPYHRIWILLLTLNLTFRICNIAINNDEKEVNNEH